jgi:hypothetical protein
MVLSFINPTLITWFYHREPNSFQKRIFSICQLHLWNLLNLVLRQQYTPDLLLSQRLDSKFPIVAKSWGKQWKNS